MGMIEVACFNARLAGRGADTMTFGLNRTRSAASSGRRSRAPSAKRYSNSNVASLDIAQLTQAIAERFMMGLCRRLGSALQDANQKQRRLLRAGRCRAKSNGAAGGEQREQQDLSQPSPWLHKIIRGPPKKPCRPATKLARFSARSLIAFGGLYHWLGAQIPCARNRIS